MSRATGATAMQLRREHRRASLDMLRRVAPQHLLATGLEEALQSGTSA